MHAFLPRVTEEEEVFNHCKNEEEERRRSLITSQKQPKEARTYPVV